LSSKFVGWDSNRGSDKYVPPDLYDEDYIVQYTDALHDEYDQVIHWCTTIYEEVYPANIKDYLLCAHRRFDIFREDGETSLPASRSPDFDSEVRGYFEGWPNMNKALLAESRSKTFSWPERDLEHMATEEREILLFDGWVTMLFRGCLNGAGHHLALGERVPSEWWGSQLPIYIG
jgi:hypothetical protein